MPVPDRYKRDPLYGKPPRWTNLYRKHCPHRTDACSRHVRVLADDVLRDPSSPVRRWLIDNGYEPDHWAESMEATVQMLWEYRELIEQLGGDWRSK